MCTQMSMPWCLELQLNSHVSTHIFHHSPQALCLSDRPIIGHRYIGPDRMAQLLSGGSIIWWNVAPIEKRCDNDKSTCWCTDLFCPVGHAELSQRLWLGSQKQPVGCKCREVMLPVLQPATHWLDVLVDTDWQHVVHLDLFIYFYLFIERVRVLLHYLFYFCLCANLHFFSAWLNKFKC